MSFGGLRPIRLERKTQKVKAARMLRRCDTSKVHQTRLLWVHRQLAGLQPLFDLRKNKAGLLFGLAVHHDVIGITHKGLLGMVLLHPSIKGHMQKEVGQ